MMLLIMKRLFAFTLWIVASVAVLSFSLILFSKSVTSHDLIVIPYSPVVLGSISSDITAKDARPQIVSAFLGRYNCPIEPHDYYGNYFVEVADEYNLDFRLLPAIAMQESNCCKKSPENSNNCGGYGIYGDTITSFSSYEEGIDKIARTLSKSYASRGLQEVDEIMTRYTPRSNGSWAVGVLYFMNQMK